MQSNSKEMQSNSKKMESEPQKPIFKKPTVLVGKIGKLPKKLNTESSSENSSANAEVVSLEKKEESLNISNEESIEEEEEELESTINEPANEIMESKPTQCSYKEPDWAGIPESNYTFEILKQGSIIGSVDLTGKSFHVFGRLPQCDLSMAHPTISRYHAVLQYRAKADEENPKGFYVYDLNSTHGTFLNKLRIKSRHYVRVMVGHMIKVGCSTRVYILTGPQEEQDEESELSVTELKEKRAEELNNRQEQAKEAQLKALADEAARRKRDEERGIDWGMGEDADEEVDLTENPFANTNNEELYLDDPKKALRGFMEREGFDFSYDCKEQGIGQFLCKINLPVDDDRGRPVVAEVLHRGKKKEAVVQCALEACRILDKYGLLRQATHESRRRKVKNWEENDFYDSDEDTFLDRTGTIEKKRELRMRAKQPHMAETFDSLSEKRKKLKEDISSIERQLNSSKKMALSMEKEDSLDQYMEELKQPSLDKEKVQNLKRDLIKFKQELANVDKLMKIAKPFEIPSSLQGKQMKNKTILKSKGCFGKRIKLMVEKPTITDVQVESSKSSSDEDENAVENISSSRKTNAKAENTKSDGKTVNTKSVDKSTPKTDKTSPNIDKTTANIGKTTNNIHEIPPKSTSSDITENPEEKDDDEEEHETEEELQTEEDLAKRRKKNQRRIQQRQGKQMAEKNKGYAEDAYKEDYNMWLPPDNQTGDGKTGLNSKFGY